MVIGGGTSTGRAAVGDVAEGTLHVLAKSDRRVRSWRARRRSSFPVWLPPARYSADTDHLRRCRIRCAASVPGAVDAVTSRP